MLRFGDSFSKKLTKPCGKIQNKLLKKEGEKAEEKEIGERKDGKDHEEGEVQGDEEGMGGRRGQVRAAATTNNRRGTAASEEPGPAQTVQHVRDRAV